MLSEKSTMLGRDILRALEKLGELPASAAATLIQLFRHDADWSTRIGSAAPLAKVRGANGEVTTALVAGLRTDGEALVRSAAAQALGRLGAVETIPVLVEALGDPHRFTRKSAAEALGRFGPAAAETASALERLLHDDDADVRRAAVTAASRLAGHSSN
jgi:HEAT repeat protein